MSLIDLALLCLAAFLAGFTDAISGGGGLIQVPAALILLPQYPAVTVIGSLKLPYRWLRVMHWVDYWAQDWRY